MQQSAIDLIKSGQLNKGGAGGTYQTQALETVLGNPGGAVQSTGKVGIASATAAASTLASLTNLGSNLLDAMLA